MKIGFPPFNQFLIALLFTFSYFGNPLHAQNGFICSFGFTSQLSNHNDPLPVNTFPILFSQNQNCVNLDNGISKFLKSATDSFLFNCMITADPKVIQFTLYPNPSSGGYITIKFTENYALQGSLVLKVLAYNGIIYFSRNVMAADLLNGYRLYLPSLPSGIYIVNISSKEAGVMLDKKLIIQR